MIVLIWCSSQLRDLCINFTMALFFFFFWWGTNTYTYQSKQKRDFKEAVSHLLLTVSGEWSFLSSPTYYTRKNPLMYNKHYLFIYFYIPHIQKNKQKQTTLKGKHITYQNSRRRPEGGRAGGMYSISYFWNIYDRQPWRTFQ